MVQYRDSSDGCAQANWRDVHPRMQTRPRHCCSLCGSSHTPCQLHFSSSRQAPTFANVQTWQCGAGSLELDIVFLAHIIQALTCTPAERRAQRVTIDSRCGPDALALQLIPTLRSELRAMCGMVSWTFLGQSVTFWIGVVLLGIALAATLVLASQLVKDGAPNFGQFEETFRLTAVNVSALFSTMGDRNGDSHALRGMATCVAGPKPLSYLAACG